MVVDPVTGLTPEEEEKIKSGLNTFYAENNITTLYQGSYWAFASSIFKKSTAEAQIELNKWSTRGLNRTFLIRIAKSICNKDLV